MSNRNSSLVLLSKAKTIATGNIFCFPGAGLAASAFRNILTNNPSTFNIYSIQYPGRENRFGEKLLDSIEKIVDDAFIDFDKAQQSYLPCYFIGYSMGAIVAYELLKRYNTVKCNLFIPIACSAPCVRTKLLDTYHLTDNEFLELLKNEFQLSKDIYQDKDLTNLLLPTIRNDFKASESYFTQSKIEKLGVNIFAIGGNRDKWIPQNQIQAWQAHTDSQFDCSILDGDHFLLDSYYKYAINKIINVNNVFLNKKTIEKVNS